MSQHQTTKNKDTWSAVSAIQQLKILNLLLRIVS
jgi:hypothetical protein